MSKFPPTLDELITEFEELEDWDERYDLIIDLGRELPSLSEKHQSEENIVSGCMSTVWLATQFSDDDEKRVQIHADSDSIIVKGLIVVLMSQFSGKPAKEVVETDAGAAFVKLGLNQHLSPQRKNGLYSMVKRLKQLSAAALAG